MLQFYIDIEDASGNKLGSGPILSATGWQVRRQMDRAGEWQFTAPLSDTRMAQATPRRYGHIYALINNVYTWVGGGPIDSIVTSIGADGVVMATVSGSDLVRELAWRSVGYLTLDNGAGVPISHTDAVAAVAGYAPAGWTITADGAPGNNYIYGQFNGESVLAALATVAERSRSHFYLSGKRQITFASTFAASLVQAVQARGQLAPGTTAIASLSLDQSSFDLYSRVIPVGAGQAMAALTLRATGRTAAAGYTLNKTVNYLKNDAVESTYGRCEQVVSFREIAPISNTTADVISASNALFDAAEYWLQLHAAPVTSYKVSVVECPSLLLPLQTIRITYRDIDAGIDLDDDLKVLSVEWQGDAAGVRTAGLTVADSGQWPASDVQAIVSSIANGQIYQALPQLNANAYVLPFSKNLDDDQANPAVFRFRFDQEVTQLSRVSFDFQLLPLESTVKSVGGSSQTTGFTGNTPSGTLQTPAATIASGGPSGGDTVSGGRHVHGVDVGTISSPAYDNLVYFKADGDDSRLYARNIASQNQVSGRVATTTSGDHEHNINHQHDIAHQHDITHQHTFTPSITTTYGVFRDAAGNQFALIDLEYSLDGSTWYLFTAGVNAFEDLTGGWYRVDLTALLQDSTTLRPLAANNSLRIRRRLGGTPAKRVTIDAQLSVRTIIQATALV